MKVEAREKHMKKHQYKKTINEQQEVIMELQTEIERLKRVVEKEVRRQNLVLQSKQPELGKCLHTVMDSNLICTFTTQSQTAPTS